MDVSQHLKYAERLSKLLDTNFKIFGFKFGYDSLIGLIPIVGDVFTLILSLYLLWIGLQMQMPANHLFKMILNILIDFGIGYIPFFGDIFDFAYRANVKNLRIIKEYSRNHYRSNVIEGEIA